MLCRHLVETHHSDPSVTELLMGVRVFIVPSLSPDHLDALPTTAQEQPLHQCLDDEVMGGPDLDTAFHEHGQSRLPGLPISTVSHGFQDSHQHCQSRLPGLPTSTVSHGCQDSPPARLGTAARTPHQHCQSRLPGHPTSTVITNTMPITRDDHRPIPWQKHS